MGLDMYLSAKKYMSKHFDKEDSARIEKVNATFGIQGLEDDDYGAQEVTFKVAYWRKANAIHKWFVDNCQDGIDECQETYISREKLEELLAVCKEVLANRDKAGELLPCQSGFFFGGTEYDEWYFQNVEYTITRFIKILNDPALEKMEFYYQASW